MGSHEPFTFRREMTFLEGYDHINIYNNRWTNNIVRETSILPLTRNISRYIIPWKFQGNVYFIDLDQSQKDGQTLKVSKVFKTNPVSQALHFSRRQSNGDNILFVGGEMSDTLLYLVTFALVSQLK